MPVDEGRAEAQPKLVLPEAPASERGEVKAWEEPVEMLSYLPDAPDPNPMFLHKRVYQGSSGEVYPLPFIDRIATEPVPHAWRALHIENHYIRAMVLPEIGGRIHVGLDKMSGYDFFYRQNVIKPALVGLAGPWISGGVEFNWPQHHRPQTFMPVETAIERHEDGSVTVWSSDIDRMSGMKGMHGVCLHPDRAAIELKVRLYNGTETTQTFLWWANVAARVHEDYQSFFPPDVQYVADHAKRAVSTFPLADGLYYGVDYGERGRNGVPEEEQPAEFRPRVPDAYAANDLSRYANIPVPTSYMIVDTEGEFFGGYDHAAQAGFVHVADRAISPGKKQWTWGNHEFGYAWDRSLTDADGPYVELMAGVYTDNQPDFSYIAPGETKTFSQFWYPLRKTGVPQAANLNAALRVDVADGQARVAVGVTWDIASASVSLLCDGEVLAQWDRAISVEDGFAESVALPAGCDAAKLRATVAADDGVLLEYSLAPLKKKDPPAAATEPPAPEEIESNDELYLTGVHLEQYRHATRSPEPYWREALRRDADDMRCNHALAKLHLKRGEYEQAEEHARRAIVRATLRNPNPEDGELHYTLGLVLRRLHRVEDAHRAFGKALWDAAWRSPAYCAMAEIECARGEWKQALEHLRLALRTNADDLNARNLCVMVLHRVGRELEANKLLAETAALDPLDEWSRWLEGKPLTESGHKSLALGLTLLRAGFAAEAHKVLEAAERAGLRHPDGSLPLVHLALARAAERLGESDDVARQLDAAAAAETTYCFPRGAEEQELLKWAIERRPDAARFHLYLGNLRFHQRRPEDAIASWERAARLEPNLAQAWRNLGMAYFNTAHDEAAAMHAFDRAHEAAPDDARVFYERDQLRKRLKTAPAERLEELMRGRELVDRRDDLTVELATLLNQTGRPQEAMDILLARQFQPWEGGEGLVLAQYEAAHAQLGRAALSAGDAEGAKKHFEQALTPPRTLGEAKHLLANRSSLFYLLGEAMQALGDGNSARAMWERAARAVRDFQGMSVQQFSEMTYWSGRALERLGRRQEARALFESMLAYATKLEGERAVIDYFATSLPDLLLFDEDLDAKQRTRAQLLQAAAHAGLGEREKARALLQQVLAADPNNVAAAELLREDA